MHLPNRTRQCLICFKELNLESHILYYFNDSPICLSCLKNLDPIDTYVSINKYKVRILYTYNPLMKKLIYQYKALKDIALKEILLASYPELKKTYKNKVFVLIPSRHKDDIERGFNPNQELAGTISNTLFLGLYKNKDYKQTNQKDRSMIFQVLKIKDGHELKGRDVVIFDDVMTSSNTMQAAISLIKQYHPKSIEGLVVASPSIRRFLHK